MTHIVLIITEIKTTSLIMTVLNPNGRELSLYMLTTD